MVAKNNDKMQSMIKVKNMLERKSQNSNRKKIEVEVRKNRAGERYINI